MGLVRQQLIRILACLVAIDLAIAVVAIFDRSDRVSVVSAGARNSNSAPPSAGSPGVAADARPGAVLAGGSFNKRRNWNTQATSEPAAAQPGATASARPSTAPFRSTPVPALSTGGSSQSKPRPAAPAGRATTTSTSGPVGVAPPPPSDTTGRPATTEPAEAPSDAAPPKPSTTGSAPPRTTTPSSTTSGVWTVLADATGDTVVDSSRAPQANARADMVQSRATNTTKGVGFAVKMAEPVDPTRDSTWTSAATFVLWEIDTSGDDKADFEVEYFLEGGKLFAGVSRVTANGRQAACEAEAGYMSESLAVGVDPACLGSPASLSYRATVYYAIAPDSDESVTDVSPDGGMSAPLRRTAA